MIGINLSGVIVLRARTQLLAAVLAFVAVLGLCGITGWHAAAFHDDDVAVAQAAGARPAQGGPDRTDPDAAIHFAAHAVGTAIDLPPQVAAALVPPVVVRAWVTTASLALPGLAPSSLLRPPRG